jgi:hypothetical protein
VNHLPNQGQRNLERESQSADDATPRTSPAGRAHAHAASHRCDGYGPIPELGVGDSGSGAFVEELAQVVGGGAQVAFPSFLGLISSVFGGVELVDDPLPGEHAGFDPASLGDPA